MFATILLLGTVMVPGCASEAGPRQVCEAEETRGCACALGGGQGLETCSSSGSSWGDCLCGDVDAGPAADGGAVDASDCVATDTTFARACYEGAVFWFDECGNKGDLIEACKLPEEACEEGICVTGCVANDHEACEGNAVWWYDSCGNKGTLVESCPENTVCANDACVASCTPHAEQFCLNDAVYWYDSCGKAETPSEICGDDEFCKGCTVDEPDCNENASCIKGFFNGDWSLTASPDTKDACGVGTATYFKQTLKLTIADGGIATGNIKVAGFDIDFEGTLDGKHLTMVGNYDQEGIPHVETIDVDFTSLSTLEGTHTDKFTFLAVDCSLYWQVTGMKN